MNDIDKIISDNEQFILKCASKTTGKFITKSDDEWSIALIAFTEAVESYDPSRGDMLPFAAMVIRRRLIDYIRKDTKYSNEISVEPEELTRTVDEETQRASAKDEIEAANTLLKTYGFSFFDLADCSPKSTKTKRECAKAVITLMNSQEFMEKMRRTRQLPMKELVLASGVSKKLVDRHRRYIIAAAEILSEEYPILAEYLDYIRKELSS
jgi:DNA-directed RNA polymerase specialized sigma subunit